jgi:hypothetical protein
MVAPTANRPAQLKRIKVGWRSAELDELISLADEYSYRTIKDLKKKAKAHEAVTSRSEYSTEKVSPEDQTPPHKFYKCLVKPTYLTDEVDELTVDGLELSDTTIDIKDAISLLKKKLKPTATMSNV